MKKRLLSILCALALCLGLLPATALAEGEHSDHSGWTALTADNFTKTFTGSGGKYYLGGDVTAGGDITVSGDVTLCLNGHVLNLNKHRIEVQSGATLTLCDCSKNVTTKGYINSDGLWTWDDDATGENVETLTGGVITGGSAGNGGGVYVNGGTFTMTGGNIAGNTATNEGGGVYVGSLYGGTFEMSGGTITGNTASNDTQVANGGGVYVASTGTFTMIDGSITNNTARNGGGVYVEGGTFNMTGGTIGGDNKNDGNTAQNGGGGVYVYSGTFNLSGGSITNNTVQNTDPNPFSTPNGGGVYVKSDTSITSNSTFTLSGDAAITGNTANRAGDISDSNVYLDANRTITIGGELTNTNNKIGVSMASPGVFTSGWSINMSDKKPEDYFTLEQEGYYVALSESEAEAALLGNPYTVKFEANGGTGTMDNQEFIYGDPQALTANTFTRTGYTFTGWSTAETDSAVYTDGQSVSNLTTESNGTVTLYAQWEINKYTVTFVSNGGTGTMGSQSFTYGTTQNLSQNTFTKEGYTFAGWNTRADGSGTAYGDRDTLTIGTANLILYAQWTANPYTVTFDANGGTGDMAPQTFTYDQEQTLTANTFTKEGYTFAGWSTTETDSVAYTDGQSVSNLTTDSNGTVTLYAQWTANTYQISYQGAENTTDLPATHTYGTDTPIPNPTKPGYTFAGWKVNEAENAVKDLTLSGTGYTADITLTASWTVNQPSNPGGADDDDDDYTPPSTTEKNPDGSTTTTTTSGGTKTETTKWPDGSQEVVKTEKDGTVTTTTTDPDGNKTEKVEQPDGTVTTTTTDADGNQTETVENPDGSSETTVAQVDGSGSVTVVDADGNVVSQATLSQAAVESAQAAGEAVALPMPSVPVTTDRASAPTVTVTLPENTAAKVEIPVENVTPGAVAVLVKADGTEEVVKTSLTTETGVAVTLNDGDTVKIVDNSRDFADVSSSYWGAEAVAFAASRELFAGTSATTFSPDTVMTRAMLVTVLARFDGVDTAAGDTWYEAGQQWAIANGVSDGTNMDQSLTREQLATMLYRYAQSVGMDTTQGGMAVREFADFEQISGFAAEAMTWAVNTGLITGTGDGALAPQDQASRAQVATILMRFCQLGQ